MNPADVTPMVLAFNEEANLGRCLSRLRWARQVLVVNNGSTDRTEEICARFPNVKILHLEPNSLADLANSGLQQIATEWVLSLDADYVVPENFSEHLESLEYSNDLAGAWARFRYCVFGCPLRASLYPPRLVLYRRSAAKYEQDGHAHRVAVVGRTTTMDTAFDHDDHKPLARWFSSQLRYAAEEADKLQAAKPGSLCLADRLRQMIFPAPFLVVVWCLFVKGCLFDGWVGWYYTFQRAVAEVLLSLEILDRRLRPGARSDFDDHPTP